MDCIEGWEEPFASQLPSSDLKAFTRVCNAALMLSLAIFCAKITCIVQYSIRSRQKAALYKGEIKVTDDVSDYQRMFGIVVPINTGHLPFDFR